VDCARAILGRELEIVRKAPDQRGLQVQPKRWAVERTFLWITAHRRLARDYEQHPARSETMIRWAMIGTWSADSPAAIPPHGRAPGHWSGWGRTRIRFGRDR
jgi:transposase